MATEMAMKGLGGGLRPKMGGGGGEKKPAAKMGEEPKGEQDGGEKGAIELHDHGDGTAHTVIEGKQEEHPDHMHAVAHIAHHLAPESSHFHGKHDGFSSHSHGVHESGEHSETKEHESPEEMHGEMDAMLGGGGEGGGEQQQGGAEHEPSLGGFQG
jgi:hypothetical protein